MKVLYVAPRFPNFGSNAAEIRINNLIPELKKSVELKVLAYPVTDAVTPPFVDESEFVRTRVLCSAFGRYWSTLFSSLPRSIDNYVNRFSVQDLDKVLHDFKPDLIHLDTLCCVGHIKRLGDYPVLLHIHDCQTKQIRSRVIFKNGVLRALDTFVQYLKVMRVEKKLYPLARCCVVDTDTDARYLKHLSPGVSVQVVPLGFDLAILGAAGKQRDLGNHAVVFSGSMGSVQTEEAVDELVQEIMPMVWRQFDTAKLYLVGANPSDKVLKVSRSDERVVLTGFVDEMAPYLRGADVYVCPLRVGSGMKTRVVEALAVGVSMVSTREGIEGLVRDKSDDGEPFLVADSSSDFADTIIQLLGDDAARHRLSMNAQAYARTQYSWQAVSERLMEIYKTIV